MSSQCNVLFTFSLRTTILFGKGVISHLPQKASKYGAEKILIVTDHGVKQAGLLEKIERLLMKNSIEIIIFDDVEAEPSFQTVEHGAVFAKQQGIKLIIALGGGSSIDVAKGIKIVAEYGGNIRVFPVTFFWTDWVKLNWIGKSVRQSVPKQWTARKRPVNHKGFLA